MLKTILISIVIALLPAALWAQPHELSLPKLRTDKAAEDSNAAKDPLANYGGEKGRHEAAVAAFQAAYTAAAARPVDRAIRLFLISLRREPMPKTLYDLGVVCARDYRWEDALSFQREAQKQTTSPEVAQLAAAELERLQTVVELEGSPAGKQIREFDIKFMQILNKTKNPIGALEDLKVIIKQYNTRWEAPALAGMLYAELHKYPESLKAFEESSHTAPADRKKHLLAAAELARQEATFTEQRISADELWEKKQYESAAQHYATAWENSPGRLDVGLLAATGFLMADRVSLAVEILTRMRALATGDMATRVLAMLRELGAVSPDAARAAKAPAESGSSSNPDTPAHMRVLVGQLTSRQMELAAKAEPPLIADKTSIIPVPDDELTGAPSNVPLLSGDHIYDLYRHDQPPPSPAPAATEPAVTPAAAPPAAPAPQTAAKAAPSASLPPAPPPPVAETPQPQAEVTHVRGEILVPVAGDPPGAVVVFDDHGTLKCTTPCQMSLAPGRHTYRATLAGYRDALNVFTVEKSKKPAPVNVSMIEKVGFVKVESSVPGQPVFLNGQKTENVTPCRLKLREGTYKISVELDGKMVTQDITVGDEQLMKIVF